MSALCVECDAELNLSKRIRLGQRVVCPNCGVELEVISTHPIEVDIAYDDGEEWDDLDGYSLDDTDVDADDLDEYARLNGYDDDDFEDFDDFDDADDDFDDNALVDDDEEDWEERPRHR
ncbi:MAG: hypothetical protein H3C34_06755 [Caldilineaceae bacterium]|nr:hypothetical protein [Caldilineaceae bacterium]